MKHFKSFSHSARHREWRRIRFSKGRAGSAVGRESEEFFKKILVELYQQKQIRWFEKTRKFSPDDWVGIDFFVGSNDGRRHEVNVKSSQTWLQKRKPNIIYVVVGLCPDKEEILEQLRKEGIIV